MKGGSERELCGSDRESHPLKRRRPGSSGRIRSGRSTGVSVPFEKCVLHPLFRDGKDRSQEVISMRYR